MLTFMMDSYNLIYQCKLILIYFYLGYSCMIASRNVSMSKNYQLLSDNTRQLSDEHKGHIYEYYLNMRIIVINI